MTATRSPGIGATPGPREPRMVEEDGELFAMWPMRCFRFMFDDGATLDVWSVRDDSDLRAAVLRHSGAQAIAGVVQLSVDPR